MARSRRPCGACAYVALLVTPLLLQGTARADDLWVSPEGDDGADGTSGAPWRTIGHAASNVAPGDVVHVLAGTYDESVSSDTSGTSDARIVFRSETPWGAAIRADDYQAWANTGDYVDIVGFDITSTGQLGIINYASYVRTIGNHVHDIPAVCGSNGGAGIDNGNYDAHDSDIIGNVVHDVGVYAAGTCPQVHGIYHSNLRGHVWNNIAYRNIGWGIHTWHAARDLVIANNLVFDNLRGGIIVGDGDSPGGVVADGFVVTNNVAIHNSQYGIIEYGNTGTSNRYVNNLVFENELGGFSLQNGNVDVGTIEADPLLVDYQADGSGDYRPTDASPCVDRGTDEGAPPDDIDARSRPQRGGFDIGPYELPDMTADADAGGARDAAAPAGVDGSIADAAAARDGSPTATSSRSTVGGSCGCRVTARGTPSAALAFAGLLIVSAGRLRRSSCRRAGSRSNGSP